MVGQRSVVCVPQAVTSALLAEHWQWCTRPAVRVCAVRQRVGSDAGRSRMQHAVCAVCGTVVRCSTAFVSIPCHGYRALQ